MIKFYFGRYTVGLFVEQPIDGIVAYEACRGPGHFALNKDLRSRRNRILRRLRMMKHPVIWYETDNGKFEATVIGRTSNGFKLTAVRAVEIP